MIASIGWLNGVNNTIVLTPVFKGQMHPIKVRITQSEFDLVRHSQDLMKAKALSVLGLTPTTPS